MKLLTLTTLTLLIATAIEANTPHTICFEDVVVSPQEHVITHAVTVEGLKSPKKVTLLGHGTYLLNGEEVKSKENWVNNGDNLQVVIQADHRDDASVRATLKIGESYDVFTVTSQKGEAGAPHPVTLECSTKALSNS